MERTGHYAVVEQLVADGVTHIFGNPGTVEQGFLDALENFPSIKYILTLQETVAIFAADAYARATLRPTIAQIHSSPGLGNAIGAMYQAMRGHSPLVVLGGDAGIRYTAMNAQMAADLVGMARPVTKWATVVQDPGSLLRILRRAMKVAVTPPMGPVYVCLPQDILDAIATEPVVPSSYPQSTVTPDAATIDSVAKTLLAARTPMFFVGDGVAFSGAQPEVARVAEILGAEVWGVDSGELNLAYDHPAWQGQTGHMFGAQSLPITTKGDVNLVVGTYMVPEVFPELGNIFAAGSQTIHIDLDADAIAKNHPVSLGLIADPKRTLAALADRLDALQSAEGKKTAAARIAAFAQHKADARAAEIARDQAKAGAVPMGFAAFASALAARIPANTVIFDEALTNSPALTRYIPPREPGSFFQIRGGSLGAGLAGGLGLKAAYPDRPVWVFNGDGGSMYVIQALWSAVRHNMDIKFVICNNRSYRLLQLNISQFWKEQNISGRPFPTSFDLSYPELHFDQIAQAMGVSSLRVERPDQINAAIDAALAHNGPFLLDVVLEGDVHPELIGVRCGH